MDDARIPARSPAIHESFGRSSAYLSTLPEITIRCASEVPS